MGWRTERLRVERVFREENMSISWKEVVRTLTREDGRRKQLEDMVEKLEQRS